VDAQPDLIKQNQALKDRLEGLRTGKGGNVNALSVWVFIFCASTVAAVVAITAALPQAQSAPLVLTIVGMMTPIILAFIGSAIQQNHLQMNSRLDELLEERGKTQFAKGKAAGKEEGA
jgi:anti-sigma-K factor RskA